LLITGLILQMANNVYKYLRGWCRVMNRLILIIAVILALLIMIGSEAKTGRSSFLAEQSTEPMWSRKLEPVILEGDQVSLLSGVDVNHIFAFAYSHGAWQQKPLQIDEVNSLGEFTPEDGLLDENDQLVFMAMDLGAFAGVGNWIQNPVSKEFPRYQIEVANPLDPSEVGYVYLYQTDTVINSPVDYVNWISSTKEIDAGTYDMGIITSPLQREETLEVNGNEVDVLDRSKFRLSVTCRSGGVGFPLYFTEDTVEIELGDFYQFEPTIDGPVRVGGGTLTWENWSYFAMRQNQFGINFDFLKDYVCEFPGTNFGRIDAFQFSFDWVDPSMTRNPSMFYFDSNNLDGVPVDGVNDSIAISPVNLWSQISGNYGSVLRLVEFGDGVIGSYENYYKDDSTEDVLDTGDQQSFGDAGYKVVFTPGQTEYGQLDVSMNEYFLDPYQPGLGANYLTFRENPLQVQVSSQYFQAVMYFPLIMTWSND
jgi:hypothetical protein